MTDLLVKLNGFALNKLQLGDDLLLNFYKNSRCLMLKAHKVQKLQHLKNIIAQC